MRPHDDDHELRGRFQALAAEDQAAVPRFALPGPAGGRRWSAGTVAIAATAVLAAAGALGWRLARPRSLPYPIDLAAVTWNAPTDFLLRTPGASLLRELPTISPGVGDSAPAPDLTDDTLRRNRT
jgi:hypothetical protein